MKLILKQNAARNILKCLFQPIIVWNAFQTKSVDNTTHAWNSLESSMTRFLPKRTLLIATNTCFIQKRLQTPGDYFSSPNLPESRLKGKGIPITSMSPSFNRGLCETRFIASVFLDPPKTWFQNKINKELPEARVTDRESAEAHVKLSLPVNRPKPFLKRKVSQIIVKCIFGCGIVVNAFRRKRPYYNALEWPHSSGTRFYPKASY